MQSFLQNLDFKIIGTLKTPHSHRRYIRCLPWEKMTGLNLSLKYLEDTFRHSEIWNILRFVHVEVVFRKWTASFLNPQITCSLLLDESAALFNSKCPNMCMVKVTTPWWWWMRESLHVCNIIFIPQRNNTWSQVKVEFLGIKKKTVQNTIKHTTQT